MKDKTQAILFFKMWIAFGLVLLATRPVHQTVTLQSVETLSQLATGKKIAELNALVEDGKPRFNVLRGGAYDVGVYGWKAVESKLPIGDQTAVVFTTPLTGEDTGELAFLRSGNKLKFLEEDNNLGIRVGRHNISVKFDIPKKKAFFVDDLQLSKDKTNPGWFVVRYSPCYHLDSLTNAGKPVPFVQLGGVLFVATPAETNFNLKFAYSGIVNLPNYAASITDTNIQLTNDYWYPMVARQPAVADINVDTPDGWTVVTMGNHVSTESKAGVQTTKYKLDIPLTYWSLTAAKMQYGGAIIDGLQLGMWSPRVPVEKMVLQAELYAPILRFYSQFAPFPFKSYGALDSPAYGGGAMEAYSFATYGGGVPSEDAHEPGHTWWGGLINNTYLKSFWNESFTVFSDGLYHRNVPIGSIADRALAFSDEGTPNQLYFATPLADSGAEHGPVASALGYGKGAHVLAMLEQIIGTKAIIASFQEWLRVHPKGVPGNWEDYEKVVTAQNKSKDLKSFFDSWIRKPGAADVQLTDAAWANGSFSGKLIWKNGSFRMPLELVFSTGVTPAKRQPSYVSVLLDTKIVKADGTFSIQLATHPKQVALDPNHKAIRVGAGPTYLSATGSRSRFKVFGDAKHPEVLDYLRRSGPLTADTPLKGSLILGDPADSPIVARLCRLAGFSFGKGTTLYHRGQKIDLKHGGGLAIVNLPEGGEAMVGVGKVKLAPNLGHATTGIFDELGRFISGETRLPTNTTWIDVK